MRKFKVKKANQTKQVRVTCYAVAANTTKPNLHFKMVGLKLSYIYIYLILTRVMIGLKNYDIYK